MKTRKPVVLSPEEQAFRDQLSARCAAIDALPFVHRPQGGCRVHWPDEVLEHPRFSPSPWREGGQWALDLARLWRDMPDVQLLSSIVADATGGQISRHLAGFLSRLEQLAILGARHADLDVWSGQIAEAEARETAAVDFAVRERREQHLAQLAAARAAKAAKRESARRASDAELAGRCAVSANSR